MEIGKARTIAAWGASIGVVALLIFQIFTAESATKTEVALFGILQFIFSVVLSWVLATISSEKQFVESQKKFAIAAFRRIKEIERAITRAQRFALTSKTSSDVIDSHVAQSIMVSLMSAQDAVNSSIADWGDIIGDEIHITKELERLKVSRKSSDKFELDYLDKMRRPAEKSDLLSNPEINKLRESLPAPLQLQNEDAYTAEDEAVRLALQSLIGEFASNGMLTLRAFWDEKDSFSGDLSGLKVGDSLFLARGFTSHRSNVLLIYKNAETWIGVVTNNLGAYDIDYDGFSELLEDFLDADLRPPQFGGNMIPVSIKAIEPFDDKGGRWYFDVLVSPAGA